MEIEKGEVGLYSKIIFCLMAKLGVTEITITDEDMKELAGDSELLDVNYKYNPTVGYVTVSYGNVKD